MQDIKHEANKKSPQKPKDKNLKYEYNPNVNLLAGWLKNILIAMIFVDTKEKKRELYDIVLKKAKKKFSYNKSKWIIWTKFIYRRKK